ncbi:MAG: LicD family protein [Oscillospiraceae bacterium]|nr:LicD family protein [Oscillospiraceae bacterium]
MKQLSLREIQLTELAMLEEFDRVAREHQLKYSLSAGTLLGAVRHQGFIPWDDDIDVMMPRPDYEKLVLLNRETRLWPEHLRLCCLEDRTLDSPYMKLFDTRTKVIEQNFRQRDVKSLWIDIFPVDGLPGNESQIRRHYDLALTLCRLNVASVVRDGYGSSRTAVILKTLFEKPLARIIGRTRISRLQKQLALRYDYSHSKKCGMVTWAYDGPGQAMTRQEFETLVELPFEGHRFFATSAWDKNLSGIFGDYMQLPPEEKRITHNLEAFFI